MEIPEKMKAVVLMGPNHFEVREVDTPAAGPEDVLIKVEATAICSSDVSLIATHSFPIDDVQEAFKTFTERIGGAIKVLVHPNA